MLLFGRPLTPEQRGSPLPAIRFAVVSTTRGKRTGVLHAFGCPRIPEHALLSQMGLEAVYSTTYDEIADHATAQFGEEGWTPCPHCGG